MDRERNSSPGLQPAVYCPGIAALAAVVALVRVVVSIPTFNNVVDEPFHIGSAVALWDMKKHVAGTEHPPLPRLVAGLPLYLSGIRMPAELRSTTVLSESQSLHLGERVLFSSDLAVEQILYRARAAMLLFPALALFYLYRLGKFAGGEIVAMLAVVFLSLDPTMLGHAFWVSTDMAACAGFLAATYHGLKWIQKSTIPHAVAAGIAVGLAIGCKFSCIFVIPGLLIVLIARRLQHHHVDAPRGKIAGQCLLAGLLGFLALWSTYLFNVAPLADQNAFDRQKPWRVIPETVRQANIPMPSLPLGLMRLLGHDLWGHPAYLNGEISRYGWWYYFPEAIAVKSPLALLAGLLLACLAIFRLLKGGACRRLWRTGYAGVVAAIFLLCAMAGNLNIGVRHVLPVIPLFYLIMCVILYRARLVLVLLLLLGIAAVESAMAHPDYLSFFNLAARKAGAGGEAILLDSNLDWGQDIRRLSAWLHTDEARGHECAFRLFAYPSEPLLKHVDLDPRATNRPPREWLAISKNVRYGLTGVELLPGGKSRATSEYSWLAKCKVVKQIGTSIDVYDVSQRDGQHTALP